MWCLLTKLLFIKTLVALELIKAHTEKNYEVSVVSRETRRYNKALWTSRV